MASLHLQLEIDSDVHPELHAVLASISRSESRAERLRQLASGGLIWELLRVQAQQPTPAATAPDWRQHLERSGEPAAAPRRPQAVPEPVAAPAAAAPPSRRDAKEVPVLDDAVDVTRLPARRAAAPKRETAAAAPSRKPAPATQNEHPPNAPRRSEPNPPPPSGGEVDDGAIGAAAAPPARQSGTRSRLLRMKERGLFNNG